MDKLVLIGGGGHCKSVIDSIDKNMYEDIVITDKDNSVLEEIMGVRIAGDDDVLAELMLKGYKKAFITVGFIKDNTLRHKLYDVTEVLDYDLINVIDKTAIVSEKAHLDKGIFIGKGVIINAECKIGKMAIINTGSIVEHECIIGEHSHIAGGTILCGNVHVGTDTFIGAGCRIIQNLTIGNNCIIGAGSIILSDVPDNSQVNGIYHS